MQKGPSLIHNYTAHDIAGIAAAILVFSILLFFPGYIFGWITDLLQFRSSTVTRKILLSLPLSIVISTISVNLVGRYISATIILWAFCIVAAVAIFYWIRHWVLLPAYSSGSIEKSTKIALILAGLWAVVVIASLVDVEIGSKLYANTALGDYAVRIAFIHSALRFRPPIRNPFYFIGSAPIARYYYYWYVLCSYPARLAHINPRYVLCGSSVWIGFLLAALIPTYLRDFLGVTENLRRKSVLGIILLSVTGLDILPTVYDFIRMRGVAQDMEWWDPTQVTSWTDAFLWVPHHVAALVACFTGFLVLWSVRKREGEAYPLWTRRVLAGMFAALAFAAAAGLSVYVTFTFALFLLCWGVRLLFKRSYGDFFLYLSTACVTVLLSLPYLHDLSPQHGSGTAVAAGGAVAVGAAAGPIGFGLRLLPAFLSTPYFLKARGFSHPGLLAPFGLIIVYFLEFGIFAIAGWERFRQDARRKSKLEEAEVACLYLVAVSMFVITFMRSSVISNNDLAFRSAMIAQFILLLWGAEYLDGWIFSTEGGRWNRLSMKNALILSTLVLGLISTFYSLTILRTYIFLEDKSIIGPPAIWLPAAPEIGADLMNTRQAYAELDTILPPRAIVQYNPMKDDYLPLLEYDKFQSVDAFPDCGTAFGGDAGKCLPVQDAIANLFNKPGDADIREVCARLSIDALVARKDDPAWQDRNSWVWTNTPIVENSYIRAFRCR
jgi:hypothetical protein